MRGRTETGRTGRQSEQAHWNPGKRRTVWYVWYGMVRYPYDSTCTECREQTLSHNRTDHSASAIFGSYSGSTPYTRSPGHAFRVAKAVGRIAIQGGLWTWETASAAARLQLSLHPRGEHLLQVHTSYTLLRSASEYPDRQLPALAAGVRPRRR